MELVILLKYLVGLFCCFRDFLEVGIFGRVEEGDKGYFFGDKDNEGGICIKMFILLNVFWSFINGGCIWYLVEFIVFSFIV